MPRITPRAFISYSRKDSEVVKEVTESLRRGGVLCWMDTFGLQVGDEWNNVIAQEIDDSDLFFAYVTDNYLASGECKKELTRALDSGRIMIVPYADSAETIAKIDDELRNKVSCGVLGAPGTQQRTDAMVELAGRAWASLQVGRRVVPSIDHILAGPAIFDSPGYTRDDLMDRTKSELVVAGANLRSWLSDHTSRDGLLKLVRDGKKRVTLVMATYESIRGMSAEGAGHLYQSVQDVRRMVDDLDDEARQRFSVYFHVGASTLSAVFVDPVKPHGIAFFSPRWAIQFLPQDRFTCVIDKSINGEELHKALYNSIFLMTQNDALSLEKMEDLGPPS